MGHVGCQEHRGLLELQCAEARQHSPVSDRRGEGPRRPRTRQPRPADTDEIAPDDRRVDRAAGRAGAQRVGPLAGAAPLDDQSHGVHPRTVPPDRPLAQSADRSGGGRPFRTGLWTRETCAAEYR